MNAAATSMPSASSRPAPHAGLRAALQACPLVAILRGIGPAHVVGVAQVLYEAGFRIIEVPLNSPEPFASISALRAALPADVQIGAGTVLEVQQVRALAEAGGTLVVMPHSDPAVVRAAKQHGMACAPGVATPTEAFAALQNGADVLKLFPAEQLGPAVLKAWRAVMAHDILLLPVGGITPANMGPFLAAGASGFGLGSALYKPGQSAAQTAVTARAFIDAWRAARTGGQA